MWRKITRQFSVYPTECGTIGIGESMERDGKNGYCVGCAKPVTREERRYYGRICKTCEVEDFESRELHDCPSCEPKFTPSRKELGEIIEKSNKALMETPIEDIDFI